MQKVYCIVLFLSLTVLTNAQNPILGRWKTIDDQTGETKSIVELFERDGKLIGKIIRIFPKPGDPADPLCTKCDPDDPRHNKRIIGMEILTNMTENGDAYSGGQILDPEVGKVYRCKIWLEGNSLKIRGYWGPFWRTQTWVKAS